jgi:hypothetical protein
MKRKYVTLDILSVAISAFNFNNQQVIRDPGKTEDGRDIVPNRQLIKDYTNGNKLLIEKGFAPNSSLTDDIVSYLQQAQLIQTLLGKNDQFLHQINAMLLTTEITEREFGLIAWAPKLAADLRKKDSIREVSSQFESRSRYIGKVGDKITTDFTLIESRYVKSMDCYAVYGHTPDDNLIFYWAKDKEKIVVDGKIQGRIKAQQEDQYRGHARVTTLNYVKAL